MIRQALGASVEELFEEFEEVPVASGSIGQVYQAKLSPKGARNTGIDPGSHPRPCHRLCYHSYWTAAQGKSRVGVSDHAVSLTTLCCKSMRCTQSA